MRPNSFVLIIAIATLPACTSPHRPIYDYEEKLDIEQATEGSTRHASELRKYTRVVRKKGEISLKQADELERAAKRIDCATSAYGFYQETSRYQIRQAIDRLSQAKNTLEEIEVEIAALSKKNTELTKAVQTTRRDISELRRLDHSDQSV